MLTPSLDNARAILEEVTARTSCSADLARLGLVRFAWNNRITRTVGRTFVRPPQDGLIEFSSKVFRHPENHGLFEEVVRHEIAHVLAPRDGHGPKWKTACLLTGAHPFPTVRLPVSPGEVHLICNDCGKLVKASAGRARRMRSHGLEGYHHTRCGGSLRWKD